MGTTPHGFRRMPTLLLAAYRGDAAAVAALPLLFQRREIVIGLGMREERVGGEVTRTRLGSRVVRAPVSDFAMQKTPIDDQNALHLAAGPGEERLAFVVAFLDLVGRDRHAPRDGAAAGRRLARVAGRQNKQSAMQRGDRASFISTRRATWCLERSRRGRGAPVVAAAATSARASDDGDDGDFWIGSVRRGCLLAGPLQKQKDRLVVVVARRANGRGARQTIGSPRRHVVGERNTKAMLAVVAEEPGRARPCCRGSRGPGQAVALQSHERADGDRAHDGHGLDARRSTRAPSATSPPHSFANDASAQISRAGAADGARR